MNIKGNNDGIIGNGKILAGLSKHGELIRMTYPSVDYRQVIDFFHVGVKINDSAIIYLHEDINNYYEQEYIPNTNILKTKIVNSYFDLEINQKDFVSVKKDIIIREYTLKNNNCIDLNIDFLVHSELTSNPENQISAKVTNDALIQYNYDYTFAVFSNQKIKSKQIHNSKDAIHSGIIYGKDYIGMSNDSSISYDLDVLKPGDEKKICVYIYAKENKDINNFEEIVYDIDKIRKIDSKKECESIKKYWEKYVDSHNTLKKEDMDERVFNIYVRSILLFPLLTNKKTGGIVAALESDENKQKSGGYGYCWTRDAVFITKALDYLGMYTAVEKFYNSFCKKTQSKNGMWEQRFYTDERLAPCWGYQIDETASVIYGIYEHYKFKKDIKFISNNLKMCEKAKEFLIKYIKHILNENEEDTVKKELIEKYGYQDEMHKQVSYDLWEMNEGVHLYSLSSIYAAFDAMINMYNLLGEDLKSNRLKYEKSEKNKLEMQEYKEKIKRFIIKNLYDDNQKILLRNMEDSKTDISLIGSTFPFNVFDAEERVIKNTIEKLNMTLRTYTGGYLRFENDSYMGGANPWPIATLWMALYYIKLGDIEHAQECLEFVVNTATKNGLLGEQIDNEKLKPNWIIGLGWSHAMFVITVNLLSEMK